MSIINDWDDSLGGTEKSLCVIMLLLLLLHVVVGIWFSSLSPLTCFRFRDDPTTRAEAVVGAIIMVAEDDDCIMAMLAPFLTIVLFQRLSSLLWEALLLLLPSSSRGEDFQLFPGGTVIKQLNIKPPVA